MFKLKNFTWSELDKALDRRFVTPKSKSLVKLAAEGKVNDFAKAFAEYPWFGTRDYTMVVITLSPLLLAQKAQNVDGIKEAYERLDPVGMGALWALIGAGKGDKLASFMNSTRGETYHSLFDAIMSVGGYENEKSEAVWKKFIGQLKKMKPWSFVNREIIEEQLLPALDELNSTISKNFLKGFGVKHLEKGSFEDIKPELDKIDVNDDNKLQALLDDYALSDDDVKKIKAICKASKGMLSDTLCKDIMETAIKVLNLEPPSVLVSLRVLENLDKFEMESVRKFVYQTVMKYYHDDYRKELEGKYKSKYGDVGTFTDQVKREWPEIKRQFLDLAKSAGETSKKLASGLWDYAKRLTGLKIEEPKPAAPDQSAKPTQPEKEEEPKKEEPKKEEPKKEEPKKGERMDVDDFLAAVGSKIHGKSLSEGEQRILEKRFSAYNDKKDDVKVGMGQGLIEIVRAFHESLPEANQKEGLKHVIDNIDKKDISTCMIEFIVDRFKDQEKYGGVRALLMQNLPRSQKTVLATLTKNLTENVGDVKPWREFLRELEGLLKNKLTSEEVDFVRKYRQESKLEHKKCAEELAPIIKGLRCMEKMEDYSHIFKGVGTTKNEVYSKAWGMHYACLDDEDTITAAMGCETELKENHKEFYENMMQQAQKKD